MRKGKGEEKKEGRAIDTSILVRVQTHPFFQFFIPFLSLSRQYRQVPLLSTTHRHEFLFSTIHPQCRSSASPLSDGDVLEDKKVNDLFYGRGHQDVQRAGELELCVIYIILPW